MVVYLDLLLVFNFMVDFILLRFTSLLAGSRAIGWRLALGAAVGSLSSLLLFAPPIPPGWMALLRLGTAGGMVLAAFGYGGAGVFLKRTLWLWGLCFLVGGICIGLRLTLRPSGFLYQNGAGYLDFDARLLLLLLGISYGGLTLLAKASERRLPTGYTGELLLETTWGNARLPAFLDTGCSLIEPFSQLPVILCERRAIEALLPPAFATDPPQYDPGIRWVPFAALGQEGLLPAFLPKAAAFFGENGQKASLPDCYLAVLGGKIGRGDAVALLPAGMVFVTTKKEASLCGNSGRK